MLASFERALLALADFEDLRLADVPLLVLLWLAGRGPAGGSSGGTREHDRVCFRAPDHGRVLRHWGRQRAEGSRAFDYDGGGWGEAMVSISINTFRRIHFDGIRMFGKCTLALPIHLRRYLYTIELMN